MHLDTLETPSAAQNPKAPAPAVDSGGATAERSAAVRHVRLLIDPSRLRRVHAELSRRLVAAGLRVTLQDAQARDPAPAPLELLFDLERLIHRVTGERLADRIDRNTIDAAPSFAGERSDIVIDLVGSQTPTSADRLVRVLYDGVSGESAAITAIVNGRMPMIELEEAGTGAVLARGIPCADNAATVLDAMDGVFARVMTLVVGLTRSSAPLTAATRPHALTPLRPRDVAAFELKSLAHAIVHRLYRLCFHTPHWRTCWRFVDGPDVWQTRTLGGAAWNVLPDPGLHFYADPFPFVHEGRTCLFVEDLDHHTQKGVIAVVPFDDRGPAGPAVPVLEEPWHLSYPFVFAHDGQVWMIPESSANRTVTLYRADPFPHRWVPEAVLLSDVQASDATVIRHDGRFWMFAATRDGAGSFSDTLSIFSATRLQGPWQPHPANPILVDQAAARPAGAVMARDGRLWRPVQDCSNGYGSGIGIAEINTLTPDTFRQTVHAVLRADPSWPGRRLHTLNRAGRLECIDGAAYSPRSRYLARHLQSWSGRREADAR